VTIEMLVVKFFKNITII